MSEFVTRMGKKSSRRCAIYWMAISALSLGNQNGIDAFSPRVPNVQLAPYRSSALFSGMAIESFIDTELRGAAMRLHTREQAPREGQAPSRQMEPYVPNHMDYLRFLVDSQHVYKAFEDIVNEKEELAVFRNTGLERTVALENDIQFMVAEYGLKRPSVGRSGIEYADVLRNLKSIPEFVCHYYNFYFAHTAGGRMIGKQMSKLLLDGRTLDFYKWEGDLNTIKSRVKDSIEAMSALWSDAEKQECVGATRAAFTGGGGINSYLLGGENPH